MSRLILGRRVVRLFYYRSASSHHPYYSLNWPPERNLVWGGVSGNRVSISSLYSSFINLNVPLGHRIYFALVAPFEHSKLTIMMDRHGEPYSEKRDSSNWTIRQWDIISQYYRSAAGHPRELLFLFGSTDKAPIIESILQDYKFQWRTFHLFPFLVSDHEPSGWKNDLEYFLKERIVRSNLIEKNHCFITTQFEHAIETVSDKVSRASLERIARNIATRLGVKFEVFDKSLS